MNVSPAYAVGRAIALARFRRLGNIIGRMGRRLDRIEFAHAPVIFVDVNGGHGALITPAVCGGGWTFGVPNLENVADKSKHSISWNCPRRSSAAVAAWSSAAPGGASPAHTRRRA